MEVPIRGKIFRFDGNCCKKNGLRREKTCRGVSSRKQIKNVYYECLESRCMIMYHVSSMGSSFYGIKVNAGYCRLTWRMIGNTTWRSIVMHVSFFFYSCRFFIIQNLIFSGKNRYINITNYYDQFLPKTGLKIRKFLNDFVYLLSTFLFNNLIFT